MTIKYPDGKPQYFDNDGAEISDGDIVFTEGRNRRVLLTDRDELGTDATNPAWIKAGRASEGDCGVYPFEECNDVFLVCKADALNTYNPVTGDYTTKEEQP